MRYEKQYHTKAAIHRMLRLGKIDREVAQTLLNTRAGVPKETAKGMIEMWVRYSIGRKW